MSSPLHLPPGLPSETGNILRDFVERAREVFGESLQAAVLFGSAAEGRLRQQSDVNLILVLSVFTPQSATELSGALALARAAVDLHVMFLETSEIPAAFQCFAQKFGDILRRHFVVYGSNPFAGYGISRDDEILRTRQVLLNLGLRLRERYTLLSSHPDKMAAAIADAVGPLRTCAAAVHAIEGKPVASPKDAFAGLLAELGVAEWGYLPQYFSDLREQGAPQVPATADVIAHLLALATTLRLRLESHL